MEPDVQVNAGPGFDSLPATEMTGSAVFYQRAMQGSGFDSFQNVIIKIGTFFNIGTLCIS